MTERKPASVSFESWVESQIQAAQDRGEFDNLTGAGKPIPPDSVLDGENWWVRKKMEREGLRYPNLADDIRRRIIEARSEAIAAPSAAAARAIVKRMNSEIHTHRISPPPGQPLILPLIDIDEVLGERARRNARTTD
ncbi:DUF1992 domain-containing protein [Tsukamurella pulmonis]|uniref:DnaJ family domain-containing protein n=1 Tax=Tsukamurella pulmonis TaxID=47312 RepID=UPI0009E6EC80|nr:DUF1992 domain-containing protein [Tsukamurella pulmonis]